MKKLLVIAIALASTNAFATRARLNSLANSNHIMDTQRIYMNPSDMFSFGDFVNLESGATTKTGTAEGADAEGMLVRSMGDSKMGLSLGHRSSNASSFGLRSALFTNLAAVPVLRNQQNPVELSYGMKMGDAVYAGTLVYSNYNDKKNEQKESSLGFRLGGRMGAWDFAWAQGLDSKATSGNTLDYKGKNNTGLYAGYTMDSMYFWGDFRMVGAEETKANQELKTTTYKVGMINSYKKDGSEFFYGLSLNSSESTFTSSSTDKKIKSLTLPLTVAFETDATSWLALRGSLTQSQIINSSKNEVLGTETDPGANNTVASVGAGLKLNKIQLDGSLTGLTGAQNLDGTNLLGQVGFTYMF